MDKLTLNSYAKLNLYLGVLNRRKDGYHNINTLFERITLSDRIILTSRRNKKIRIISNSPDIPKDSANLAYRSAKLLQDSFRINSGVDIKILKRIPVGAGLGGGSSNAAAVLLGLNKLWQLKLSRAKLVNLARKIGSDIPFFIYNCPFAQGLSRGDRIKPLKALANLKLWHILVVPKIKVSTPLIYKKWDKDKKVKLTKKKYNANILFLALKSRNFALISKALFNNLEQVTAGLYPQLDIIKEKLLHLGAKSILMSGSGPAVFCIVSSRREGQALCRQLKGRRRSWQLFVTRTV